MIETERCFIHSFQKSDSEDVKELYGNEEVRKYLGGVRDEDSMEVALQEVLQSNDGSHYWVVRKKDGNHFLGMVSLSPHHDGVYFEVSYQFLPKWWGVGYATEVVQAVLDYAFVEMKLSKVVAETQTANVDSCRLLERLGMSVEKTLERFGAEQALYSITNR